MVYNLTGIASNSTDPLAMIQAVNNNLMSGWFGVLILIMLAGVLFMSFMFSTRDFRKSLMSTSFIVFLLSVLLAAMNLMSGFVIIITLILLAGTVALSSRQQ